ncbi:MAG: acyl-ACP--UDP-N-acetylglucosamine O-acyltransferase [Armatimonadota bacterium]
MSIHPTAVVDPGAEIADDVVIGPYCVIGRHARIGRGTRLESHVSVEQHTTIGEDCQVRQGAVLGGPPQDHKYRGERTFVQIGNRNIIREFVTIHRATGEGEATRIGDDNMIMAYCHIGHNCWLGNGIMMANSVGISGHCVIEDRVVFGGIVGLHQFVRIGKFAMIGGMSKVVRDVPPFMMADGRPTQLVGLNVLGLRRSGMPPRVRAGLKQAFRLLYQSNLNLTQGIEAAYNEVEPSEERDYLLEFLTNIRHGYGGRQNDRRG